MDRKNCIRRTKEIIYENRDKDIESVLGDLDFDSSLELISSLIYSLGYESVRCSGEGPWMIFYGGMAGRESEILRYDLQSRKFHGLLESDIKSAFFIISEIEGFLSDSIELPHDMRQKRIDSVIKASGESSDRYSLILRNWKSL